MNPTSDQPDPRAAAFTARRCFGVALGFLAIVALLGALLRWQMIRPMEGFAYGNWLHAHSHTAFLGFIFNAFFAFALARFVPAAEARAYRTIFVVLQVAVLGMLATFPAQGYAPASIAFSTLHMAGSAVFAWRLWRNNLTAPAARGHLRVALGFLVASGLGPLALGPIAALGLRDTPPYQLCIYFYLHAQYNGWFLFFLQSLALHERATSGPAAPDARASALALRWLGAGAVLTLAQSTLWLGPPVWVYVVAGLGGVAQLVGFVHLLRALRGTAAAPIASGPALSGAARVLAALALGAYALKLVIQTAAAWPALDVLASHRFVVIAFLHLVFLGIVTPAILAWALRTRWLRDGLAARLALGIFFVAAAASEAILVLAAFGWSPPGGLPSLLFGTAILMAASALLLLIAFLLSVPRLRPTSSS